MEKKERGDLLKGWLNQAPPSCPPALLTAPDTHTSQAKTHNPVPPALTHYQTHYRSLHLHVYTHFLFVFSLMCQWKGALAECGASIFCLFVCLFGVHASCPEFDLLKEEKKERKMKSERDVEGGWSMGMIGWCSCFDSANERQQSVSIPIQLQKSVTDCNWINKKIKKTGWKGNRMRKNEQRKKSDGEEQGI